MKYVSKVIHACVHVAEHILKRKILFVSHKSNQYLNAVKSSTGFWYCGHIFNTNDIAYGLAVNGVVEEKETLLVQKILSQLPKNYTLLDIGANTGYYGIMSSFLFPESKSYTFEPLKIHTDMIHESAYLNRLTNIDINQYALGATNEQQEIYVAGLGSTLIKEFTQNTQDTIKVDVKKLDDVILQKNITSVEFIKIDVEGFELVVLKGAEQILKTSKPILFIEICHTKDGRDGVFLNKNFQTTVNHIKDLGYSLQILDDSGLKSFTNESTPPKGVWMFLCLHTEKHKSITL